jgi:hypothetical protein
VYRKSAVSIGNSGGFYKNAKTIFVVNPTLLKILPLLLASNQQSFYIEVKPFANFMTGIGNVICCFYCLADKCWNMMFCKTVSR